MATKKIETLAEHLRCPCGSGEYGEPLYDARGIYVSKVCEKCEAKIKAGFRSDIFTDSDYWHDEPIEEPD